MFKGYKIYSILTGRCPRCHQESMYQEPNAYKTTRTLKMNERCSSCGLKYQIEPSFFFGAMYTSYGVGVAIGVAVFILTYGFVESKPIYSFYSIAGALILLFPVIARLGRNLWINFFINYDPTFRDHSKEHNLKN